jgi:hypothetical protein
MASERERTDGLSLGPAPFSDSMDSGGGVATSEGHVQVIHGVYAHHLPLAGMTVAQARYELADRMNIDPEAIAIVDGDEADEDTVLVENQVLNFVKHAGERG